MEPNSLPISLMMMEQESLSRRVAALEAHSLTAQLQLIVSQLSAMRTSLDQIGLATSRYAGFAFAEAFTPGGRFGAPPMIAGSLAVHIVNIRDLVASSGIAGFFEGLLGGIGRFFGGLFGGIIGGTIAGVALPVMIGMMDTIVTTIERIINRFGIGGGPPAPTKPETPTGALGESATDQLGELRSILDLATGLVEAAGSGEPPAAGRLQASLTPAAERWLEMLRTVQSVVGGITRLVNGLTLLVPVLVGSLALLIDKLDAIKLAIIDVLQFVVRNVLVLRGLVLVTVFDLIASAARLAAGLVGILAETIRNALTGVFALIGTILQGALGVFQFLAGGLQRTVNALLGWVVDTLFVVLARLGDLRIFRLITHIVRVLPAVLPPLYELIRPAGSAALTPTQQADLSAAAALAIPGPAVAGTLPSASLPALPNIADAVAPAAATAALQTALDDTRQGLLRGVDDTLGALRTGLREIGSSMTSLVQDELTRNTERFRPQLDQVRTRSAEVADAFAVAERAARERPRTGLEAIAQAYQRWLVGSGFRSMLDTLTASFRATPPSDTGSIPGAVATESIDRPRASIEIADVVIDLTPPTPPRPAAEPHAARDIESITMEVLAHLDELQRRGLRFVPGAPMAAAV
ncbi:MAG: hypothetical protein B7Y45_03025 [Sphingomonas sp. 28-66-16]|nr:MAG: hypothetical protein B7Y45_03025 [Sphingomonas sp. 28-66-16]